MRPSDTVADMWPATAWDDADWEGARARGWTVMGRLKARQASLYNHAVQARRRAAERTRKQGDLLPAASAGVERDALRAQWCGGPMVLVFLFALPDSEALRTLDARGDYFDCRTGDTWDLFFPGYYKSTDSHLEMQTGARPIGRQFATDWFFNARDFNLFRDQIQRLSDGRWSYSGGADLVLVNGWMPETGDLIIDWLSTISGSLSDDDGTKTLTVAQVIERLTRDLESGAEDPSYGVGDVTAPATAAGQRRATNHDRSTRRRCGGPRKE